MTLPAGGDGHHPSAHSWETIRYALESNARTVRLCAIMLVASVPPVCLPGDTPTACFAWRELAANVGIGGASRGLVVDLGPEPIERGNRLACTGPRAKGNAS
jgi:hypothetical protein